MPLAFLLASVIGGIAAAGADQNRPPPPELVWPDPNEKKAKLRGADLASLKRLVSRYDFEDAERFPRLLPQNWYRVLSSSVARPGYPDFGAVGLSDDLAHSGRWSLRFDLDGGAMAVALPPGVVRVFPGSRYRLSAWVRTEDLQQAGARVTVRFYGADGTPTGDEFVTEPTRTEGEWRQLQIELPQIPKDVVDVSVELELVQPSTLQPFMQRRPLDDVRGRVWFDDLEIWQIPVIHFSAEGIGQVFSAGKEPVVTVGLHDLVSDRLNARISVVDVDGHEVAVSDALIAGSGGRISVPLGITAPGWYRATLAVLDADGVAVARRELDFAIVEDRPVRPRTRAPRFGLALTSAPMRSTELESTLLRAMAPDFAVIPMWNSGFDTARSGTQIELLRPFIEELLDARIEPVLSLTTVPLNGVRDRHVDEWQTISYFGADDAAVRAMMEPWLFAFGQHISRWQIGSLDSPLAREAPDVPAARRIYDFFDRSVASLVLYLPTMSDVEPVELPNGLARNALLPWAARPGTTDEYAMPWRGDQTIVSIERAPETELSNRTRIDDLAHRTLDLWRAGTKNLAVELPLRPANNDGTPAALMPEAIAWRELSAWLSDRSFGGTLSLGPDIDCWIVRGSDFTALLAWSADGTPRTVEMPLGNGPLRVRDLMGRTTVVDSSLAGHRFEVASTPILIEGANPALVSFLASARIDPGTLESRRAGQSVDIVLTNPFSTSLSGSISTSDRADWTISPRQQPFMVSPGGTTRIPVRITLPRSAVTGSTLLAFEIDLSATESMEARLFLPVSVDWPAVEVSRSWRLARSVETGSVDLIVSVTVRNASTEPLDLEAFAAAPGYPQTRKPILKLAPGTSATRSFAFGGGARALSGQSVFAGVNALDGDRRLATTLAIPPLLPPPPPGE